MTWYKNLMSREFGTRGGLCEIALLLVASLLFLTNLGHGYLWQDEAQTALIARTVLHGGLPLGYDGLNFFSQELGADYGRDYLWRWHPWFPFYLLALFFSFHISTFTARLPFALFGLGTVALVYFLVREALQNRRLALLAALILTCSVPFLLLSRQSKYLSLTAFFSLLALYGYLRLVSGRRYGTLIAAGALILLFNTHYLYCAPLAVAMLIHTFVYHRQLTVKVILLYIAVGVVNVPGILWYGGISHSSGLETVHDVMTSLNYGANFLVQLYHHVFTAGMLLAFLGIWIAGSLRTGRLIALDERTRQFVALLALFVGTCLLLLSATSPAPFFRYLSPVIPVLCIFLALVAEAAWLRSPVVGLLLVAFVICSNPVSAYLGELTGSYNGPMEGIVAYLEQNAKPGEVVAITYEDLPLKFYTPLRVVGGLTGEDLSPARSADWVIIRKHVICEKDAYVRHYLETNIDWNRYRPIPIASPDIAFENRESPEEHRYQTVEWEDPVVIYKKVR